MPERNSKPPTTPKTRFTVPGLTQETAEQVIAILQDRLVCYSDLHLTLKHVHWNVVGPNFIAVHQMIDPQVDVVRLFADAAAERIAALGASPKGTPGAIVSARTWDDYPLGRDTAQTHLAALDKVYDGVIESNRKAMDALADLDLVTQDMMITQTEALEQFHWFVRAHLENAAGTIPS